MDHPFEDKRAAQLLSRVGDDLSSLRSDVKSLLGHTTRYTLPDSAHELARRGRNRLLNGRDYAAGRVRDLGQSAREHPAGVSLAGVVLLGAVAAGVYYLIKSDRCRRHRDAARLAESASEVELDEASGRPEFDVVE